MDINYSLLMGILVVIENLILIGFRYFQGNISSGEWTSYKLQILNLIVIAIFSYYVAKAQRKMNEIQKDEMEEANIRTKKILENTLDVSNEMVEHIDGIVGDVYVLDESLTVTQGAMDELAESTNETADAIQNQLVQTEAITSVIQEVKESSSKVARNIQETKDVIEVGSNNIEQLVGQVEQTERVNIVVGEELQSLTKNMTEMFSIIGIINNIATQIGRAHV